MSVCKTPCANCPFRKVGGIELEHGRIEGIAAHITENDFNVFHCHKTVHGRTGGKWVENPETGESEYKNSGKELLCMGAVAYAARAGRLPVSARLALSFGQITTDDIEQAKEVIIPPVALSRR